MSLGYSIGDFVSLLELTNRIRKRFVRAPIEFKEISEDVKKLGVVLQDIDDFESEQGLNPQQKASIVQISQVCHEVLTELEQMLDKYQELDHEMDTLDRDKETEMSLCVSADKHGRTLMHHLLQSPSGSKVHMIALLLDYGANVNHIDLDGNSPLSIYLRTFRQFGDRRKVCRFLLKRGADPLWTDGRGQNLAHLAMHNQEAEVEVLELLKAHDVDLSLKDKDARSILHHGAIHGSISEEMIRFLHRDNIDGIHERDLEDKSPLMYAEEAATIKRRWLDEPRGRRKSWEALKQMQIYELANAAAEINVRS